MESNSILVFFQGHEALIKKNTYFSKFIEDIQRNFHIDNRNMNEYQILATVEFNDNKTRDYPINTDTNYRNIILGNYCVNYIQIKNKKETPKNTFITKNSNSSINNNSNKKKNYNENSSSKELSNNKMNIEKEINNLKKIVDANNKDIKTLFEIVKEMQININYIMRNNTTSASSTPSNSNSSKKVNNNFNNNFNNNINNNYNNNINNNYNNNNNINSINENSNSSKGISKSNIYNKNIKNPNNNSEFNINKNQNINVYNSVLPNKNVNNKFTKYKVDFILYKNKFPVIIKSQLNSNNFRNLEIKIKNTGIDLPARCKIKSINQSFMKIEPTFINNGKPIKNNELINVILNIKFEMIKNIKQGNYDIQICLFNEYDKEVLIICEEKITVKIIDSETNIVTNKYNNNMNNNYNNYLINDEVSSYNLFGKNMNYLNNINKNYGNYNNNSNKNVNSSYKNSNNNVYMNNKRSNY